MDHLIVDEIPHLKSPIMLASFAGWPDAQEAATGAIKHLGKQLPSKKFAEIDSEEFYVFTRTRPQVGNNVAGERGVLWPTNEFSYWRSESGARDILLFSGVEPQLKWKTYAATIVDVAIQHDVEMIIVLGSMLDGVPHTRAPRVTGSANVKDVEELLSQRDFGGADYQGPTGINSALMEECTRNGLKYASLWGHAPHYLQTSPNPRVSLALARRLAGVLDLDVSLEELEASCAPFDQRVLRSMANNEETVNYVRGLEEKYDLAVGRMEEDPHDGLPDSDIVIEELEAFLRERTPRDDSDPYDSGDVFTRS